MLHLVLHLGSFLLLLRSFLVCFSLTFFEFPLPHLPNTLLDYLYSSLLLLYVCSFVVYLKLLAMDVGLFALVAIQMVFLQNSQIPLLFLLAFPMIAYYLMVDY